MNRGFVVGLAVGLGALATWAYLPGEGGPAWTQPVLRAALFAATLWVLLRGRDDKTILAGLGVIASVALASHVHLGRFHGGGQVLHHHELFNYCIGSKYFPELGYDGHYLATHRALLENDATLDAEIGVVKNLRTYQLDGREVTRARSQSVAARFTEARWEEFRDDVGFFQTLIPREVWPLLMVDHGYNATPFWTLVGGSITNRVELDRANLAAMACLDVVLVLLMLALVRWAFGTRATLVFAIFFLASSFETFEFTGGAFLRQIWLFALVGFACCWQRGHAALAGALLAVAVLDRLFPVLLVIAPAVALVRHVSTARDLRHPSASLLAVFAATVVLLGLASGSVELWLACYDNLAAHSRWFFLNQISLRTLLIVDPLATSELIAAGWDESAWLRQREGLDAATRWTLFGLRMGLGLLMVAWVWRRRDLLAGVALLAFAPFVLLYPAGYYFTLLALPLLAMGSHRGLALTVLALQVPLWLLRIAFPPPLELELANWFASLLLLLALTGHLVYELRARLAPVLGGLLVLLVAGLAADALGGDAPGEGVDLAAAQVEARAGAQASNQAMAAFGGAWSRNDQVTINCDQPGGRVELRLASPEAGLRTLRLDLTAAPMHGRVQIALDGKTLGPPVDLYSPRLMPRPWLAQDVGVTLGDNLLTLEVVGKNPASAGHHLGIDRAWLLPAPPPSRDQALERAVSWILAHPADLFDGGRADVAAELVILARLAAAPALADRAELLTDEVSRRSQTLDRRRTGRVFASESEWLVAAAFEAARAGEPLELLQDIEPQLRRLAQRPHELGGDYRPLFLCSYLQRLDGDADPSPCPLDRGALVSASRGLLTLTGNSAGVGRELDTTRAIEVSSLAADLSLEVLALTDLGREPPPAELTGGLWSALLDGGLSFALQTGDTLTTAHLMAATACLDLEPTLTRWNEGLERLRLLQLPDGSFGLADPNAANPSRQLTLLVALVLALAD